MVTFHCHVMFSFFLGGVIWSINETKPHWWLTYLWWLELVWKPLQTFFLATGGFGFCNFVLNVAAEKTQWGSPFIHIFLTKNFLSFTTLHIAPLEKELGGGFKCFWNFHPFIWGRFLFWLLILQRGWNHQLEKFWQIYWVVLLDCCFLWMAIFFRLLCCETPRNSRYLGVKSCKQSMSAWSQSFSLEAIVWVCLCAQVWYLQIYACVHIFEKNIYDLLSF